MVDSPVALILELLPDKVLPVDLITVFELKTLSLGIVVKDCVLVLGKLQLGHTVEVNVLIDVVAVLELPCVLIE